MGKYEYSGNISTNVHFDYFPFEVKDKTKTSYEIAYEINPSLEDYEQWKIEREVSLLEMDPDDVLNRPFETLSKGEQTKVLLAILFLRENNFLLIDEPTNHLDAQSRVAVAKYLNGKKSVDKHEGFTNFVNNEDGFNKLGFTMLGENISYGYKLNGVHVIEWMYAGDKPHNDNQLDNRWNYVGIGVNGLATCLIFGTGKF